MRILLVGRDGQLGRAMGGVLDPFGIITAVARGELDLAHTESITPLLDRVDPDLIINCAAYTAVDRAESQPELAFAVNATAPGVLANWAAQHRASLIHFSTDYVFDGRKSEPYLESDATNPLSVYGRSKLAGELEIMSTLAPHLILRTSWVYGVEGNNFFNTMLRLARERDALSIVSDQIGAPTSTGTLASAVAKILTQCGVERRALASAFVERGGIFHAVCSGSTSWFGFAQRIFELVRDPGRKMQTLNAISTAQYPTPVVRPGNSRLSTGLLAGRWGIVFPSWEDALGDVARDHQAGLRN